MSLTCKKLMVRYFQILITWWKMDSEDILMELWQWNEPRHSQIQPKQISYNILKDPVFFPSTVFFWHKFWPMAALGRWGSRNCVDMCLPSVEVLLGSCPSLQSLKLSIFLIFYSWTGIWEPENSWIASGHLKNTVEKSTELEV